MWGGHGGRTVQLTQGVGTGGQFGVAKGAVPFLKPVRTPANCLSERPWISCWGGGNREGLGLREQKQRHSRSSPPPQTDAADHPRGNVHWERVLSLVTAWTQLTLTNDER